MERINPKLMPLVHEINESVQEVAAKQMHSGAGISLLDVGEIMNFIQEQHLAALQVRKGPEDGNLKGTGISLPPRIKEISELLMTAIQHIKKDGDTYPDILLALSTVSTNLYIQSSK